MCHPAEAYEHCKSVRFHAVRWLYWPDDELLAAQKEVTSVTDSMVSIYRVIIKQDETKLWTDENVQENPQSRYPVLGSRFEPVISEI